MNIRIGKRRHGCPVSSRTSRMAAVAVMILSLRSAYDILISRTSNFVAVTTTFWQTVLVLALEMQQAYLLATQMEEHGSSRLDKL